MAVAKISDIIVPEVWVPYMLEKTTEKSELIKSGIVSMDPRYDVLAQQGGSTINMPYFNDLDGDDEVLSDSDSLTPGGISTFQDVAVLHLRGRAWGANDLAGALAGADPMAAIADRVAAWWVRKEQSMLLKMLSGVFASDSMSGHILDVTGNTSNTISGDVMIDAFTLLGDQAEKITAMCVHSAVYATMQKNNLIDFVEESDAKIRIPYYMNRRVIVDDTMPTETVTIDSTDYTAYNTYLFGADCIARGEGNAPVGAETDRDSLAGVDYLINRRHFLLHPRGVKWTGSSVAGAAPTNAELATSDNWTLVYDDKDVPLINLKTLI